MRIRSRASGETYVEFTEEEAQVIRAFRFQMEAENLERRALNMRNKAILEATGHRDDGQHLTGPEDR